MLPTANLSAMPAIVMKGSAIIRHVQRTPCSYHELDSLSGLPVDPIQTAEDMDLVGKRSRWYSCMEKRRTIC